MTAVRFGVIAGPLGEARKVIPIARSVENAGFELLGLGDNQSLWRDVYVELTLAATATSRIRIGPCVTNVVTRNLAVTAGAIASIDELSGGRAFLGLGPGDSAVFNVGAQPARHAELERGVQSIRAMLAGEDAGAMHVRWARRTVPICLSAEGPKALVLAGRVADGVFVSFGLGREHVDAAEQCVRAGAAEAGRDGDAIEVWHAARVSIADSQAEAVRGARTGMASVAHHALRQSPASKGVPVELLPAFEELNDNYRPGEHAKVGESFNELLVERLGLMPYLLDRYAIAGTPEQCARRLNDLTRAGVRRLLLMFSGPDLEHQVDRWRREVMSRSTAGG